MVPWRISAPDLWKSLRPQWSTTAEIAAADTPSPIPLPELSQSEAAAAATLAPEGPPAENLAEVFRFDVTNGWVLRRWPRVSTGMAELPLQGYRVPLVTGTAETDLAGALTYYFGAKQEVQRIRFRGATGDPSVLVGLMTGRYGFTRRLTNDPALFVYEVARPGKEPASVMKIRSAPVVKSNNPNQRFEIDLVIERAS